MWHFVSSPFTLREYPSVWQCKVKVRLAKVNHLALSWKHLALMWKSVALFIIVESFFLIFARCTPYMLFEELAKKRRIWEIELVPDLLDRVPSAS